VELYFLVISLLLGLAAGSFLNVVIYRLPRGESLVRGPSHCPKCEQRIASYDNVPLLSWLLLRARCRRCRAPIPVRYPLVEGITAAGFGLAFWRFGFDWFLLVSWAFIASMVAVAFIDFDHMIIPNKIVIPGAIVGLAASLGLHQQSWWAFVAGSAGAALFMFILALLWPGGMGPGDIKMALFLGAVLGVYVVVAIFAAFLFGSIAGVYLLLAKRRSRKDKIPFGPALAVGAVLAILAGEGLLNSYLSVYN